MRPYKCPVCEGRGSVDATFYVGKGSASTAANPEMCQACGGFGIVWSPARIETIKEKLSLIRRKSRARFGKAWARLAQS